MKYLKRLKKLPADIALALIWIYQKAVSPLCPPSCRFHPTCSRYTAEAIRKHGLLKGVWFGTVRILKCQPFYKGNFFDPVPPKNGDTDLDE